MRFCKALIDALAMLNCFCFHHRRHLSHSLALALMYLDIPHICIFGLSNKQKECKVVFEWEGIKLSHRELLLHIIQYA